MFQEIYASAEKFLTPQTLQETYATAVDEAVRITKADYGTLFLDQNGRLIRVYSNVPPTRRAQPRKDGYTQTSYKTGESYVMSSSILVKAHPELYKKGVRSLLIIPLTHHGRTIGVLTLQAKKNKHFTKERFEALKVFGSLFSLAIEKNRLYTDLRNAIRTRDLFISMAAHELRTPTTTIQGYVQLMKKKYQNNEIPPKKWTDILYAETIRLGNLLQELMQIEQIKTGQLNYKWKKNSLKKIIERAISYAKVTHIKHRVVFNNVLEGKEDSLESDFDKLLQVLITLINNSVKFSGEGSKISIQLSYDEPYYKILVKDEGMGIPQKELPHIFEGFYKVRDNTKEGFGLGLFLAENIIQRHNGMISAKSKLGKGTLIEIKLPNK